MSRSSELLKADMPLDEFFALAESLASWAAPLNHAERARLGRMLGRHCVRFWNASQRKSGDTLMECSAEMEDLYMDVRERASVPHEPEENWPMPKYRVHLQTVASTYIEVEAEDKDEAYDKAVNGPMPHICAQCSGWGNDQNLELSDAWEMPDHLTIDEGVEEVEG